MFQLMKKTFIIIFLLVLFLNNPFCIAQPTVKISKPRLELEDNHINIFFDILNSRQTDIFRIWVEITDSTGNNIAARSLSGDIGDNVRGGDEKKITWDYAADRIYPETGIYVQVNAEIITTIQSKDMKMPEIKISRGGAILRSTVFPGWGLSRINKGKPHWIKGVAGYGCIAASVIYNRKAVSSYDDYDKSEDISQRDKLYNNSVKQDNLSEIFAYTAAGIWMIDLIWTIAGSSKQKNETNFSQARRFSVYPVYEPHMRAQMVTFTYTF